jgi:hypothetical protein
MFNFNNQAWLVSARFDLDQTGHGPGLVGAEAALI